MKLLFWSFFFLLFSVNKQCWVKDVIKALKIEVRTNIIHLPESADFEEESGAVIGQEEQCIVSEH